MKRSIIAGVLGFVSSHIVTYQDANEDTMISCGDVVLSVQ